MRKATARFTLADRQREVARQDRRAAAAERRAERALQLETELDERKRIYNNVGR